MTTVAVSFSNTESAEVRAIKLDVMYTPSGDLRRDLATIQRAEEFGFDAVWAREEAHNPFFPLTMAAKATSELLLGAGDALAFPPQPDGNGADRLGPGAAIRWQIRPWLKRGGFGAK